MFDGHSGPCVLVCMLTHIRLFVTPWTVACRLLSPWVSQGRIVEEEWVTISSSRGSSQLRDQTRVSCVGRWALYLCDTWEAQASLWNIYKGSC